MRLPLRALSALLASLLLLPSSSSFAQENDRPNSLDDGAWALLFQVDGIPALDFFDGVLAVKHHFSPKRAIRFGIGGNGGTSGDAAHVQVGASVQSQYLVYPAPDREVNLYIGAGPKAAVNYFRQERPDRPDHRREAWEVGLTGRLGVEWFATRSISLMGEYGNELSIRFEDRNDAVVDSSFRDYLYRSSAKLGIAAYF